MAIWHYFSKDENKRAKFIFNFIAPIYAKLTKPIEEKYNSAIEIINTEVNLKDKEILDVGTGTGVWGYKFLQKGAKKVTGIDFAENMVNVAKKKYPQIEFIECDAEKMQKIKDNSFDIVTASFVLHGVKKDKRFLILNQMKRVSKKHIIIHDFFGNTDLFVRLLEYLEQSDYKYFKDHFCDELRELFGNCKVIRTLKGTGVYFTEVK